MNLFSVIRLPRGLRARGRLVDLAEWTRDPTAVISFLSVPAAVLIYIFVSDPLGFIPTAFLLLLALFLWFRARPIVALPVAAGMTLLVHWFFAGLMRVPLPRGVLDPIL